MIVAASNLRDELLAIGFEPVEVRDAKCYLPSCAWLKKFGAWLVEDLPPYASEKYDCDDFAIRALDRSNDALRKTDKIRGCGHAFGYAVIGLKDGANWFGNVMDRTLFHAVNICRTPEGWVFFEPSLGQFQPFNAVTNETIYSRNFAFI